MREVARATLDDAEGSLEEAKRAYLAARDGRSLRARLARRFNKDGLAARRRAYRDAAERCNQIRQSWREQETAAGRRRGLVGGDARVERS